MLSSFPKSDKPPQSPLDFDRNPFLQAGRPEGLQDLGKVLWNMKIACTGLSADAVSERELNTSCLTFRDMQPPGPADSSSILQKARETPSRKRKSPFKNQEDDTLRFQDRVAQLITRNILNQSKRKFPFKTQKDDVSRFQDRMTHFEAQITSARTTEAASKALTSRQNPQHPEPSGPNDSVSLQEKARNRRQLPSFVDSVFKDSIISYEETIYRVVHFVFQDRTMSYEEKIARLRGHVTENIRYSKAKKAERGSLSLEHMLWRMFNTLRQKRLKVNYLHYATSPLIPFRGDIFKSSNLKWTLPHYTQRWRVRFPRSSRNDSPDSALTILAESKAPPKRRDQSPLIHLAQNISQNTTAEMQKQQPKISQTH